MLYKPPVEHVCCCYWSCISLASQVLCNSTSVTDGTHPVHVHIVCAYFMSSSSGGKTSSPSLNPFLGIIVTSCRLYAYPNVHASSVRSHARVCAHSHIYIYIYTRIYIYIIYIHIYTEMHVWPILYFCIAIHTNMHTCNKKNISLQRDIDANTHTHI